jgi:hypothetical protein
MDLPRIGQHTRQAASARGNNLASSLFSLNLLPLNLLSLKLGETLLGIGIVRIELQRGAKLRGRRFTLGVGKKGVATLGVLKH